MQTAYDTSSADPCSSEKTALFSEIMAMLAEQRKITNEWCDLADKMGYEKLKESFAVSSHELVDDVIADFHTHIDDLRNDLGNSNN